RRLARAHHLPVFGLPEAVERSDIIFLALPDTTMPVVFRRQIAPHLRAGQTLLFAHGFTVVYKTVVPPPTVDIIMVAPKGLGEMVRREFVAGRGVPALVAVEHDFTGQARAIAFASAKAIGGARPGRTAPTFRAETETDPFGDLV